MSRPLKIRRSIMLCKIVLLLKPIYRFIVTVTICDRRNSVWSKNPKEHFKRNNRKTMSTLSEKRSGSFKKS